MDNYPKAQHFDKAAADIKKYGKDLSNEILLNLYSLFKQATVGDVNIPQPSFYQLEAKAKYNAWLGQKGKSQEQAKQEYVEAVLNLLPDSVKAEYN